MAVRATQKYHAIAVVGPIRRCQPSVQSAGRDRGAAAPQAKEQGLALECVHLFEHERDYEHEHEHDG